MAKGFFTQGVVVLLRRGVAIDDVQSLLSGFHVVKKTVDSEDWVFGGPSLLVEYRPEANGYASVDVVSRKWPDHMGDPKEDSKLFAAWTMGHFGPYTYPDALKRATGQSWAWNGAAAGVDSHEAFLRIRLSYVFGSDKDTPMASEDCDALSELGFINDLVSALLKHPEAICYFNPNGEVLLDAPLLKQTLSFHQEHELPPFLLWSNVRIFKLDENWALMDSIGNWQLDIPDQEVGFPTDQFASKEVDNFIRNVSLYVLQKGPIIKDGNTMDGPGDTRWQAKQLSNGLCNPPRTVIRWLPCGKFTLPAELVEDRAASDHGS